MKKIVIIGPAHPLRGGLATFDERLAQAFAHEGDHVRIETFSLQYPNFLFPGKTQFSEDEAPKNLDITVSINSINPFNWLKIGLKIKREKPDLVICRFWLPFMAPCLGSILRLVKGNKTTKIIGLIDNIIPHEKRFGDRPFAQYFVNACDSFLVMSKAVETEMRQFTTSKPVVFSPHPIYDNYGEIVEKNIAKKMLQLDDRKKYLLFFGFIRAYKGLDLLLEAMPLLENKDIKLIVAGEFYGDENIYKEKINDLKIDNQLILHTDFISNDMVRYYFCAADLVVQPYKTATQSGISQIAYHFNKPMVVTNVGGLAEIVPHGEAGYVVEPNATEIANAINDFFRSEKHQKENSFLEGIIAQKKRFSWETMTKAFRDL